MALDDIVDFIDLVPGAVEIQTRFHHLDPQVILFVDHQAQLFLGVNRDGARPVRIGMFATDQLAFDEELAIKIFEVGDIDETSGHPVGCPCSTVRGRWIRYLPGRCRCICE